MVRKMSKVLFFCIPAHGHVNPTLALTEELVKNGEQVVYYCAEEFREKIQKTGAEFRTLNSSYEHRVAGISKNIFTILRLGMEANREMTVQALEEVNREKPDYVIYDFMVFFGRVINITMNVPTVVSVPVFVLNKHTLKEFPPGFRLKMLGMALIGLRDIVKLISIARWYRKHYGINVSDTLSLQQIYNELNIVYTSRFFQPGFNAHDKHFKFIGPEMYHKREIQNFPVNILKEKKVIYISLGTAFGNKPKFYHMCFRAFGNSDMQVILSVGSLVDISKLKNVPRNFMVRNHVPQLQILKYVDVFITHGGMNSTAEGIVYGVPLIVFPQAADQYLVARRVEQLGAGIYLKRPTAKKLRKTVNDILSDPKYKKNCEIIANSFVESGGAKAGVRAMFDFKNDRSGYDKKGTK